MSTIITKDGHANLLLDWGSGHPVVFSHGWPLTDNWYGHLLCSVLFDEVAVILSDEGAKVLSMETAAIDFVRDAFGHLKAIAVDKGGQGLLNIGNVGQDAGVVDTNDKDAFIAVAKPMGPGKVRSNTSIKGGNKWPGQTL